MHSTVKEERVECKVRKLPIDERRDDFQSKSSFESRDCYGDVIEKPQDFVPLDIRGLEAEMDFGAAVVWFLQTRGKKKGGCSLPRLTNGYNDDRPQTQIPLSKTNITC